MPIQVLVQRSVDLEYVIRVVDAATTARTQPGEAIEVDLREVRMGGIRTQRFGKSKSGVVEAVAVSQSQFAVLQEIEAYVQDQRRRKSVHVIQRRTPVDLIQNRTGGVVAGERPASLEQSVVMPEVVEQLVPAADIEIEPAQFVVESVELTRRADIVVVGSVHVSGEVRQVDETQDILGDRADLGGGNEIVGERLPRHARALPHAAGRIVNLIVCAEPQQR